MSLAVTESSRLSDALALHPDVLDWVVALNPHDFERLRNPLMRKLMPRRITLARLAAMTGTPIGRLLEDLHRVAGIELAPRELASLRARADEPGPAPAASAPAPEWTDAPDPVVVDLLAADERLDADPMPPINRALNTHPAGTVVLVKHKWEPQPLYDVWARIGVEHHARRIGPDEWWIWLLKPAP